MLNKVEKQSPSSICSFECASRVNGHFTYRGSTNSNQHK